MFAVASGARGLVLAFGLAAARALVPGCNSGVRRLDEHIYCTGAGYPRKVVRYYEQLLLHYSGEIYSAR